VRGQGYPWFGCVDQRGGLRVVQVDGRESTAGRLRFGQPRGVFIPGPGVCDQILHQTQSLVRVELASLRGFEALAERVVHHPGAVRSPAGGVLLKPRPGRRVKLIGKV
jgi:hypothetical protein